MPNTAMTIQVPGKLMIAGEFAVLEPYQKLAVMAVNRFVYVTIKPADKKRITLEKFHLQDIQWDVDNYRVTIYSDDPRVNFVQGALDVACLYLIEKGIPIQNVSLHIKSELDDKSTGKKFGLGSSAAVVVGVISAILAFHLEKEPSPLLIFKLASISHVKAQGNGSGADVAASSYGGILQYSSFQAEWLRDTYLKASSISELIDIDWDYWSIESIDMPKSIHLCIGWTGSPASTGNLVQRILNLKTTQIEKYQTFLKQSEKAVSNFLQGAKQEHIPLLLQGIKQNREALVTVGKEAQTELETTMIKTLCDLAEEFGGAAKQSGAGGGDCGIAFMPSEESAKRLEDAWKKAGIIPLEIKPYRNGALII
ncbi:phosphomevalonate kinase [Ornithinibacillus bavariensis]|uniref:phosphomevalonate kinase n=1 Tax=Ornithinibacillus bavariensis TaxID=545502 RepID=A0A920C7A9_9BACI|nr:phosphomevalonate kinase [Ornithinibacillus bavariensis]